MTVRLFCIICIFLVGCGRHHNAHRSPLRKATYNLPTLVVSNNNHTEYYARTSSAYKEYPIFTVFDKAFFIDHLLPTTGIQCTNTNVTIPHEVLNTLLENVVDAVIHNKKVFPECTIIRDANFNYHTGCGLLILKTNNYPLVIKLFRETAESFVNPYGKGLEPVTFFFMSGGSNRHIAGLTRIPNREYLLKITQESSVWRNMIHIPRKWYWAPKHIDWLKIKGYNIDGKKRIKTRIPSTYAVIADYVDAEEQHFLNIHAKKELLMNLCTFCTLHLDPHIKNFIITQKDPNTDPIITIVDTEDHQCMTGIRNPAPCANYLEWYTMLAGKFLKNILFNIKTDIT